MIGILNNLCSFDSSILNYLNERIVLYCIICIAFAGVFSLYWILKTYTFFIKAKVPSFRKPKFPYGHFAPVILKDTQFSVHLDKLYKKYKKEKCKFGGLFLFTGPIILIVDPDVVQLPLDEKRTSKYQKILEIFRKDILKEVNLVNPVENDSNLDLKDTIHKIVLKAFGLIEADVEEDIERLLEKRNQPVKRFCLYLIWNMFNDNNHSKEYLNLQANIKSVIENRKKNDVRKNDLIDGVIKLYNTESCSLEEVVRTTADLVLDSLEYSYNTALFCLFELASNSQIQEDLSAEIRRSSGPLRERCDIEKIEKLVYLDAVVKETFRKYPPVPTVVLRKLPEQVLSHHKLLSKCRCALIPTFSLQRDSTAYLQPSVFDPDRFLEDEVSDSFFMPFGTNESSQINMVLTTLFTKIGLVQILKKARVSTDLQATTEIEFNADYFKLRAKDVFKFKFS